MNPMNASQISTHPTSRPPPPPASSIRIPEGGFIPETMLDAWTRAGHASRSGPVLAMADGRSFVLQDAVRVLGRRNGDTDPYGLTGRVESLREFVKRGASVSAACLRLGQAVYDIEYGALSVPVV